MAEDVLVDTSVWVDFYREGSEDLTLELRGLREGNRLFTTYLVVAELMVGAGDEREAARLKMDFSYLPRLVASEEDWYDAALLRLRALARGSRVGGRSPGLPDCFLAALAIRHRAALWTFDRALESLREYGLRLHRPTSR